MAILRYYVDWNNDGNFGHPNSDITQYVMPASWRFGRNTAHEYDSAGTASLTLDNSSSIFSSFNTASPLYGKILPNIRVRITMTSGGVTTTMWQGYLESILPVVGVSTSVSTAELVAYGPLAQFNEGEVAVPLQENIDTGSALSALLNEDGYSATERRIDTGLTTISKWWVRPGSRRLQAMRELQAAEFGRIREGKDGYLCFESRANPFTAPRNTPQATYGTGVLRMWNVRQENPILGVFNTISSEIHTFNVSEDIVLVTIADVPGNQGGVPPVVPGNGSLTIDIDYPTASSPGNYIAVDSWGMVDYEANTQADRTGADITDDVSATKTAKGSRLTVVFNNANPQDAHLVVLRARGVAIVEGDPIPVSSEDAASQAKYRKREYPYPSPWLTYLPDGKTYCDYIISVFKDLRPRLTFDVKGDYDANHLDEVRQRDIGDRIRVVASLADYGLAIDAEFIIDSLAYSVDTSGMIVMTVSCTQAPVTQLGPLATPYDPKTIPQPTGGVPPVPDDLWTRAILRHGRILFACAADKWNAGINGADFRCKRIPLGDTYPETVDLRTTAEGGTFAHDGVNNFIVENIAASQAGINYQLFFDSDHRGRYYFAFRLRNEAGWSVWSDGNDDPEYVDDYCDTESSVAVDTGPPSDWTVQIVAGPQSGTCQIVASRPKVNGSRIFSVVFQIRDTSEGGSWRTIDANAGAAATYFDGSAIDAIYDPMAGTITFPPGTDFSACANQDIMLVCDVRKSQFALPHCFWVAFNPDRIVGTQLIGLSNLTFAFQPDAAGENTGKYVGVRCKLVRPPWSFIDLYGHDAPNTDGYQALAGYDNVGEYWLLPQGADTNTTTFKSNPIAIPTGKTLADLQGTAFFWTSYSISNAGIYSPNGIPGDTEDGVINLTYNTTITIDCKLGGIFYVTLTGGASLAPLVNAKHGCPVILVVKQDETGGHTLSLDTKYTYGAEIPASSVVIASQPGARSYFGFIYDADADLIDVVAFVSGYQEVA
jgi:hypothetical protein